MYTVSGSILVNVDIYIYTLALYKYIVYTLSCFSNQCFIRALSSL